MITMPDSSRTKIYRTHLSPAAVPIGKDSRTIRVLG